MMGGMDGLGDEAADETNAQLDEKESALLRATKVDLEALRPKVSDQKSFDKLMAAVEEATAANMSVAEFRSRLEALGGGVAKVATELMKYI